MAIFVALLRAINVGGTGKLPMGDLCQLCEAAGFRGARTYIQSGNVVFASHLAEAKVKEKLEKALDAKLGKPYSVIVRSGVEIEKVLQRNPYTQAEPSKVLVLFLDQAPERDALAGLVIPGQEKIRLDGREVFIYFPDGQGKSKLKLPFSKIGTARNLNTVAKLVEMVRGWRTTQKAATMAM